MVRLRFNSLSGTDPATLGPAPFFRIEGPLLQQGVDRLVVGRYFDHHWEVGDRFVSSYESMGPVCLQFEGATGRVSQIYGPFHQVRFPNGSCYADRLLFAELVDEEGHAHAAGLVRGQWVHRAELTRWSALLIRPVEAELGRGMSVATPISR
ncbi:MAG TPA: hypothetical protein VHB68_15160 [Steroidobacteraceae bacterium]|nr:hypothetical protein [Steroidobacteraceae bacterium]